MEKFKCIICNYSTSRRDNYLRHERTPKHKKKSAENVKQEVHKKIPSFFTCTSTAPQLHLKSTQNREYKCTYCKNIFTRSNSLSRHKKKCGDRKNMEIKIDKLTNKVKALTQKNKQNTSYYIKEMDHYKEEAKYFRYLFEEAGGMVKKSISSASFIQQKYVNGPPIKPLSIKDLKGLEQDKIKLANNILYTYRHDTIDKYIGDQIIATCLKRDPNQQYIWNTDSSRFTYMIRNVINKVSIWQVDKGGRETARYLIDPIMKEIKELMLNHYKNECQIKEDDNVERCVQLTKDSNTILNLIENINDKIINNKILKYITPPLTFRRDLIK
jgi:hypothetical protein